MPSIKLRAISAYSTLRDPHINEPPSLASLFMPTSNAHSDNIIRPLPPRMQRSLPTLRTRSSTPLDLPPPLPVGRPRSGTTTSRIQSYIYSSRRSPRVAAIDNDSRSSIIPIASPDTIEVDSGTQSSAIHNALGLSNSEHDFDNLRVVNNLSQSDLHHDDVVEHLDVIDAEIAAASGLTNAANSIIFPPLSWYSRKPVLILPATPPTTSGSDVERHHESPFEDFLDRHVDDVLRRRSKFRRTVRGIWSFLKTPMGVITAIYGFLVAFWGAAIVLFVAKIINLHNPDRQGFWVEVSSQIENGLFTITGIGLIPSRVLDTYRIYWIWYYKRKTRRLRAQAGLPQLLDEDDLPDPVYDPNYVHVLTDDEEKNLHKQQRKFQHHQTWYRPHGTETHRAFPINTALLICLLVDGNSIFQIMLCGTMWGLNRFQRPAWSTGTLIPCSFLCGIFAAVLIWRGGQKTKRVAEVEERLRAALAAEKPASEIPTEKQGADNRPHSAQRHDKSSQPDDKELQVDEYMTIPRLIEKRLPSSSN